MNWVAFLLADTELVIFGPYLNSGVNYVESGSMPTNLQAGNTYEWEDDFAIKDVQIVVCSGQYTAMFS